MTSATRRNVAECERLLIRAASVLERAWRGQALTFEELDLVNAVRDLRRAKRSYARSEIKYYVIKRGEWGHDYGLVDVTKYGQPSWRIGQRVAWNKTEAEKYAELFGGRIEVAAP